MVNFKRFLLVSPSVLKYFLLITLTCAGIRLVVIHTMMNTHFKTDNNRVLNAIYPNIVNHKDTQLKKCRNESNNALLLEDTFQTKNGGHISIETILSANFTHQMYCKNYQRNNMTLSPYADKYGIKSLLPKFAPTLKFSTLLAHVDDCGEITEKLLDQLPGNYMMKATHLSGGIVRVSGDMVTCIKVPYIPRKEVEPKLSYLRRLCARFLKIDYWRSRNKQGEMFYKNIPKRIIFEEDFAPLGNITEYRFWVFNQEPVFVAINSNRKLAEFGFNVNIRTLDWQEVTGVNIREDHVYQCMRRIPLPDEPPPFFPQIIAHAREIGKLFVLARVDFFVFNNNEYRFSEITMCAGNCRLQYEPPIMEYLLGYSFAHREVDFDLPHIIKKFT